MRAGGIAQVYTLDILLAIGHAKTDLKCSESKRRLYKRIRGPTYVKYERRLPAD
jgi:hypothetical protein